MNELSAKRTTRYTISPHLHTRLQQWRMVDNLYTSNCVPGILTKLGSSIGGDPWFIPIIVKTTCQAATSRKLANFSAMPIHLKMLKEKITWTRHDWEMGMAGNQYVWSSVCLAFCRWRTWVFVLKTQLHPFFPAHESGQNEHRKSCGLPAVTYRPMNSLWRQFS